MRLGKFTGCIYNEDYDFNQCPECCAIIPEDISNDEKKHAKWINERRVENQIICLCCYGCPASSDFWRYVKKVLIDENREIDIDIFSNERMKIEMKN